MPVPSEAARSPAADEPRGFSALSQGRAIDQRTDALAAFASPESGEASRFNDRFNDFKKKEDSYQMTNIQMAAQGVGAEMQALKQTNSAQYEAVRTLLAKQ